MLIRRELTPSEKTAQVGTVMYYGSVHASTTKRERVLPPTTSIIIMNPIDGSSYESVARFGRLVRMLPGRICEIDTTVEEKPHD